MESRFSLDTFTKVHFRNFLFIKRQRSDRPTCQLFISTQHLVRNSFPVEQNIGTIINTSCIFYQYLQSSRSFLYIQHYIILIVTAIQTCHLLSVNQNYGIITQILYNQFLFACLVYGSLIVYVTEVDSQIFH